MNWQKQSFFDCYGIIRYRIYPFVQRIILEDK